MAIFGALFVSKQAGFQRSAARRSVRPGGRVLVCGRAEAGCGMDPRGCSGACDCGPDHALDRYLHAHLHARSERLQAFAPVRGHGKEKQ